MGLDSSAIPWRSTSAATSTLLGPFISARCNCRQAFSPRCIVRRGRAARCWYSASCATVEEQPLRSMALSSRYKHYLMSSGNTQRETQLIVEDHFPTSDHLKALI